MTILYLNLGFLDLFLWAALKLKVEHEPARSKYFTIN